MSRDSLSRALFACRAAMSAPGIAALLALPAVSHAEHKSAFEKTTFASITASLPQGSALAPGGTATLLVTFTASDGKLWSTAGVGKDKVSWDDLHIVATVVSLSNKGIISLPPDPRSIEGKTGHLTITVPSHPDLHTELDIAPRYDVPYVATVTGRPGTTGSDGIVGLDGNPGSAGSTNSERPSAGGDGSAGTRGTEGTDGSPGEDTPPLTIHLALRPGDHPLLQSRISAPNHVDQFYLIDPKSGSLTVKSIGGPGGAGGRGGRGGHGGNGGAGTPNGNQGAEGTPGNDGNEGHAGKSGDITVIYDPQAKPYLSALHLSNPGGAPPEFKEETVPPLW